MTNGIEDNKKLTVCVYLAGTRSDKAFTLLDSLRATPGFGTRWDVIIGIDCVSYDLAHYTRSEHRSGSRAIFIETKASLGKERFFLSMVANVRSLYVLLLDDEALLTKDWMSHIETLISTKRPNGISGAEIRSANGESPPLLHPSAILIKTAFLRNVEKQFGALPSPIEYIPFDDTLSAAIGLSPTHAKPFDLETVKLSHGLTERTLPVSNSSPLFSACLCTYGDHPELILRCLDSILREPFFSRDIEVLLGCNATSERVMNELEQRYARDRMTTIIRSPVNINKSGMQRLLFRLAQGPYVLSLDDDMYFKAGWFGPMKDFILKHHPFEAAGRLHALSSRQGWSGKKKPYHEFVERKRWWRGKQPFKDEVHFPAGQCFLVRRSFVIENDYPDLGMKIDWDDVLLGDMVIQLDGSQLFFSEDLFSRIVVDDIPSRGQHGGG